MIKATKTFFVLKTFGFDAIQNVFFLNRKLKCSLDWRFFSVLLIRRQKIASHHYTIINLNLSKYRMYKKYRKHRMAKNTIKKIISDQTCCKLTLLFFTTNTQVTCQTQTVNCRLRLQSRERVRKKRKFSVAKKVGKVEKKFSHEVASLEFQGKKRKDMASCPSIVNCVQ